MTHVTGVDAAGWARSFDEVLERIGCRFGPVQAYLRGLPASVECENGWQLNWRKRRAMPRPTEFRSS